MKSCKLKILKNSCFKNICFLDPPYDTDFSTYAQNEFGHEEQKRLCECLKRTPAKILLIIKNTDFSLNNSKVLILGFGKCGLILLRDFLT